MAPSHATHRPPTRRSAPPANGPQTHDHWTPAALILRYIGHGEAFHRDDQVLWWSKGGTFAGESVKRISFLKQLLEELPTPLEPIDMAWDAPCAGRPGEFYLYYYGLNQPSYRRFLLDPDVTYQAKIIDTWEMKVSDYPHEVSGRFTIELPAKPYTALLLRAVRKDT